MSKTTNFPGCIGNMISAANTEKFTLTVDVLIEFIEMVVAVITMELPALGINALITSQQAILALQQMYFTAQGKFHEDKKFSNDQATLISIYEAAYALLTVDDFRSEAARIIYNIRHDERFAYKFLYGTSIKHGKSIAPLRSKLLWDVLKSYKVAIAPDDFSTLIYERLFSDGTWSALRSFSYRTTFFQWLSYVASTCIFEYLVKNGFVKTDPSRTPANTKLVLDKKSPDYCEAVIGDLVFVPSMREILLAVYVERLKPAEIQSRFNMDEKTYEKNLNAAEHALKTLQINSVNPYDDVLELKKNNKILVSSDFLDIIGQTRSACTEDSPLREALGITPDDPDFELKVIDFLYDFSNNLGWSEEDTFVWQSRFIKRMAPESVAEDLNRMALENAAAAENVTIRSRGWVDTRYHRVGERFEIAVRNWWSELNPTL